MHRGNMTTVIRLYFACIRIREPDLNTKIIADVSTLCKPCFCYIVLLREYFVLAFLFLRFPVASTCYVIP